MKLIVTGGADQRRGPGAGRRGPVHPRSVALLANGWLLGREFFELAALRHLSAPQERCAAPPACRQDLCGGLLIAVLTLIPGIDLIAPFSAPL
ncbi:MAG: hypothetical protein WDM81_15800 [Rhizomicrobium sp.]